MKFIVIAIIFIFFMNIDAQNSEKKNPIEIYLIDSYVTSELPHKFFLTFFTSDSCTSQLYINNKIITVSESLTDDHKLALDITKFKFDSVYVPYTIHIKDKKGNEYISDKYDVTLPYKVEMSDKVSQNLFEMCLGAVIFSLPSPTYVFRGANEHFSLTKEIPLFAFYGGGYNYPKGYISAEYSHIFKADRKNFLRGGYKYMIQIPVIEYISPGADYFTDFRGFNGVSLELSAGFFKFYNVFTIYARYRYNFQPRTAGNDFNELSVGLYSSFFSLNF